MGKNVESSMLDTLGEMDGVSSARKQSPHVVLTVEHPPLDSAVTLREIEAHSDRSHSKIVNNLPGWATVAFTNALEVFITVEQAEE